MSKNKVIKSISFNITNKEDVEILKKIQVKDFNFSGYVKRLILEDIRKEQAKVIRVSGGIKHVVT